MSLTFSTDMSVTSLSAIVELNRDATLKGHLNQEREKQLSYSDICVNEHT